MRKITLLFACLFLSGINAQTSLRVLGTATRLYDINDIGNAVHSGGYYNYSTNTSTPKESEAQSTNKLNNAGDVAGTMSFVAEDGSNLSQAAYRKNGTWTAIGYFPGDVPGNSWFGNANAISENSRYVTGQISVGVSGSYPFVYDTENNTLTKLSSGDADWDYARGEGINDSGVVSGFVSRSTDGIWVPVYFDASGILYYIDGGTVEYGEAADVNNSGKVVGYKGGKAFIYDINTGIYKSFGSTLDITNPVFSSISENGLVIGYEGNLGNRNVIVYHEGMSAPMLLKTYLALKGVDITTFDGKLGTGMGVSPDGKYICGFDNTAPVFFAAGWVVHLDELPYEPGCLTAPNGMNPAAAYIPSCNGSTETITTTAKTGEYSLVQLTAGKQYTFSSSVNTDFITIANEAGTEVIRYGTGSVSYKPIADRTIRFSLNLSGNCSYSSDTRSKYVSCVELAGCQWTVHVYDDSGNLGDEVSWTLKDEDGVILLSGGDYGSEYDDTQTINTSGPLTFYIESQGWWGDNSPSYTVSNGTEVLASGSLDYWGQQEATHSNLNCATMAVADAQKSALKIYPNPVNDILNISSDKNMKSVSVYSLDGRMVINNMIVNDKTKQLNVSHLPAGSYMAVILTDGNTKTFKFIKK